MNLKCYLLDATNGALKAVKWIYASLSPTDTMDGIPLGDSAGDGSGQIGVKVLVVGGSAPSGSGTPVFIAFAATAVSTALPSNLARNVSIFNNTGGIVTVTRGGIDFILPDATGNVFHLTANTNELMVKATGAFTLAMEAWG